MIFFYRVLYLLVKWVAKIGAALINSPFKNWIALREKQLPRNKSVYSSEKTIWFHAASGEIEYCKSVIREIKKKSPSNSIVLTYTSPSAQKLFFNIQSEVSEFIPLPWDRPSSMRELIQYINPSIVVFSRTDLWPELIHQLQTQQIKYGVISFIRSKKGVNRWLQNNLLTNSAFISCVDQVSASALITELNKSHITADGDPRFDQVFHRLEQPSKLNLTTSGRVFTAGSLWPEDEEIILPLFSYMLEKGMNLILSPHDVSEENISRLINELNYLKIPYQRLSTQLNQSELGLQNSVLLIDAIGFLPDCYRFSDFAFVGGSFKEKVHSVMEPLCCGLPVLVGPYYRNNPEAVRFSRPPFKFVTEIKSTEDFVNFIDDYFVEKKKALPFSKEQIVTELRKNQNVSSKLANFILGKT